MAKIKTPKAKDLFNAGVHFGHQIRRWNPEMEKYIYAVRKNIHIIDLAQTEELLKEACEYLYEVASKGGQIIFVGTKRQARDAIVIEAKRAGALYIAERWLGGTITNFDIIKKNMQKLTQLKKDREAGNFTKYTKKEQLLIDRQITKLEKSVGGIVGLRSVPAALFVVDVRREKTAIREAHLAGVKVVGVVDTNSSPKGIDYVIPGNDDAIKSVVLFLKVIADAVELGYKAYADQLEKDAKKAEKAAEKAEKAAEKAEKAAEKAEKETEKLAKKEQKK